MAFEQTTNESGNIPNNKFNGGEYPMQEGAGCGEYPMQEGAGYYEAVAFQNSEDLEHYEPKQFISEKDYNVFRENGDDLDKCITAFHNDMPEFLRRRWQEQYATEIDIFQTAEDPITKFNEMIGDYPSFGGYAILDDLFTFVEEEDLNLLSHDTYIVLGYFYDIHLH